MHTVLIGGGHTHVLVLREIAAAGGQREPITLIDPDTEAYYSGMLPGHIAGHYTRESLTFDLAAIAKSAGATYLQGRVIGLDLTAQTLEIAGGGGVQTELSYDIASLDVGIHSAMPEIEGFTEHATPVKPLAQFARRWEAFAEAPSGPVCVIGGGVAGVEIALAAAHRTGGAVHLVEAGDEIARHVPARTRAKMLAALDRYGVQLFLGQGVARVTAEGVGLQQGRELSAGFVIGAGGARPHRWLAANGLTDARGFVPVGEMLQSGMSPRLFAVGDCAEMTYAPRPKAGVFAVRQAPVLGHNLRAIADGTALKPYLPQRDYLKLMSLGEKCALADWYGISAQGAWLWRLKDRIDRGFMRRASGT